MAIDITNSKFSNCTVGVRSRGVPIKAKNVHFENVLQPWDIQGGDVDISGSRISRDPKVPSKSSNKSHVGWRRPNGPPLPATCNECGSIFPSKNYNIGSSLFYSRDNEEVCPSCGNEHARLAEGVFDLTKELVEVLQAPDITRAMLLSIQEISSAALEEKITPSEAISKLEVIKPEFGTIARKALTIGIVAFQVISAAYSIGAYYVSYQSLEISKQQLALSKEQMEREKASKSDELLQLIHRDLSELVFQGAISSDSHDKCQSDASDDLKLSKDGASSPPLPRKRPEE